MRARFLLALSALGAMASAAGACAVGGTFDSGAGGTPSQGGGGAGGTSASSTAESASSSAAESSSSTGTPCSETPCKLTAEQCGCEEGKQCSIVGTTIKCVAEGTVPWGGACSGANKCEPVTLCVNTSAPGSTCAKFCADDDDCQAPGGLCILHLNDGMGGSIPDVALCTENCDPSTNAGCPIAGASCQLGQEQDGQMRWLTFCDGSGAKTDLQTCDPMVNDCAPTFGCFNIAQPGDPEDDVCLKYCKVGGAPCPNFALCQSIGQVGNNDFGVCF